MITESQQKEGVIKSAAKSLDKALATARLSDIYGQGISFKNAIAKLKAEDIRDHLNMSLYRDANVRQLENSYSLEFIDSIRKDLKANADAVTAFVLGIKNRGVLKVISAKKIPKKNSTAYMNVSGMLKPGVIQYEMGYRTIGFDGFVPDDEKEFVNAIDEQFENIRVYSLMRNRPIEQAKATQNSTLEDFCRVFRTQLDALEKTLPSSEKAKKIANDHVQKEMRLTDVDLVIIDIIAQLLASKYEAWAEVRAKKTPGRPNINRIGNETQVAPWKVMASISETQIAYRGDKSSLELLNKSSKTGRPTTYMRLALPVIDQLKANSLQENDELTAKAADTITALFSYYDNELGRELPKDKKVEVQVSDVEKYIPAISGRQQKISKGLYVYEGLRFWAGGLMDMIVLKKDASADMSSGSLIASVSTNVPADSRQISAITVEFTDMFKRVVESPRELWAVMSGTLQLQDPRYKKIAVDIEYKQGQQTAKTANGLPIEYTVGELIEIGGIKYDKKNLSRAKRTIADLLRHLSNSGAIGRYTINDDPALDIFKIGAGEQKFLSARIQMYPTKEKIDTYRDENKYQKESKRKMREQEEFTAAFNNLLGIKDYDKTKRRQVKRYGTLDSFRRDIIDSAVEKGYEISLSEEQMYELMDGGVPTEEVRLTVLEMLKDEYFYHKK